MLKAAVVPIGVLVAPGPQLRCTVNQLRRHPRIDRIFGGNVTTLADKEYESVHADGHPLDSWAYENWSAAKIDDDWVLPGLRPSRSADLCTTRRHIFSNGGLRA